MTDVRIAQRTERVVVGVDTHADLHVAAALDPLGRMLGRLEVGTSSRGYAQPCVACDAQLARSLKPSTLEHRRRGPAPVALPSASG